MIATVTRITNGREISYLIKEILFGVKDFTLVFDLGFARFEWDKFMVTLSK